MRFHNVPDFAFSGGGSLPQGAAVAIAPSSWVDTCLVGDSVLTPGAIVPWAQEVKALRGYRSGALGSATERIASTLSLVVFGACDPWVSPGPRTGRYHSAKSIAHGTTVGTAALALRVPFSGRKQAVISFRRDNATVTEATLVVRGVRYLSRARILEDATQDPYFEEIDAGETLFDGTGAIPTSLLGGSLVRLGKTFYIGGGGDLQEGFDELELWLYGAAGALYVQAEVSGERG